MRYLFGTMALLAAIVIVGYSAATLFASAYNASSEPWQQMLNGVGAAAVVGWEASALLLIGACWHRGYKPVAVMATFALLAAMAATLSWEARSIIGGQADKFASREIDAKKLIGIEDDLAWLRKRRDSVAGRKDLDWITNRIAEREKERSQSHAVSEVLPQAAWASRMFGGSEQKWQDIFLAIPLVFWMIARIVAIPLAVAGMTGAVRRPIEAPRTAEEPRGIVMAPITLPAVQHPPVAPRIESFVRPEEPSEPEPPVPPKKPVPDPVAAPEPVAFIPRLVTHETKPRPAKPQRELNGSRDVDQITNQWIDARTIRTSLAFGSMAKVLYPEYCAYCRENGIKPVDNSHLGRSIRRLKVEAGKRGAEGAIWGLQLVPEAKAVAVA